MLFLGFSMMSVLICVLFLSWNTALFMALAMAPMPYAFDVPLTVSFLLSVGPLLVWRIGRVFQHRASLFLEGRQDLLREKELEVEQKHRGLEEKKASNQTLEVRIREVTALYELTKKTTASLEFLEIFALLQEALRDNLSFENGWLFLLGGQDDLPVTKGQFRLPSKVRITMEEARVAPPFLGPLVKEYMEQKKPFYLKKDSKYPLQDPCVGVPLLVKNQLKGFLFLEGFHPSEEERFFILANQFALAIQKIQLYEKIQQLAITDGLTKLSTRRYFLERFYEELARSKRYRLNLAFLMGDIDHFKEHNDRCGHLVGDVVLREVASLIKGSVREIDLVGRYGGEEFGIVLPDTPLEGALQVAQRIRSAIEAHEFAAYDEMLHVTISLGIGVYPENGEDPVGLIDIADAALYHAKKGGRNRVCTSRMLA